MMYERREFLIGASRVIFGQPLSAAPGSTAAANPTVAVTLAGNLPPMDAISRIAQANGIRLH